ncbi:hypothetical protein BVRB_5g117510 [Beta vulgaris subsp. vulgaris]|nr:hypothetical protein BVRB_5g117510 [Beta vulgaris subsp. vulgaris]
MFRASVINLYRHGGDSPLDNTPPTHSCAGSVAQAHEHTSTWTQCCSQSPFPHYYSKLPCYLYCESVPDFLRIRIPEFEVSVRPLLENRTVGPSVIASSTSCSGCLTFAANTILFPDSAPLLLLGHQNSVFSVSYSASMIPSIPDISSSPLLISPLEVCPSREKI